MKASIVILSYNRFEYLKNTVNSLIKSLINRDDFEIIIVDNGSIDESPDYIKKMIENHSIDKAILFKENQGISKGFNSGFAIADTNSNFLIKLDCDIVINHQGWFEEMEMIFKSDESIGLLMLFQENHPTMPSCIRTLHKTGKEFISLDEIIVGSACFTIPKSTINKIGYFNEDHDLILFYDDIDYYIRLSLINQKAFYLLSHTSYYQTNLDETTYYEYDKNKDPLYEKMNLVHKTLYKRYVDGELPIFKSYNRMIELNEKYQDRKLIEIN
jgi:glycosyltransferase involved in cell wall biosynthesis